VMAGVSACAMKGRTMRGVVSASLSFMFIWFIIPRREGCFHQRGKNVEENGRVAGLMMVYSLSAHKG
jgi:hypothetical protein